MAIGLKNKPGTKPRTLADFPQVAEAQKRLADLQSQHAELKTQVDALPKTQIGREQSSIAQKAADLAEGKRPDPTQPTANELTEKAKVLDHAVKIATQAVQHEHRIASAEICRAELPKRRALIEGAIAAIESLGETYQKMGSQNDELRRAGVAGALPVPQLQSLPLLAQAVRFLAGAGGENLLRKIRRDNHLKGRK